MTDARKRHLLLDLSEKTEPVPASRLREISPRVAEAYATKTQKTLMRDIGELMEANLIRREKEGYVANQEMILAFLPPRAR